MPRPSKLTDDAHAEIEAEAVARLGCVSDKELSIRTGVSRSRIQQIMRAVRDRLKIDRRLVSRGTKG